jgi:predicted glycoside hydrolase/deacetylase ChbG (UPF0249 family)
MPQSVFLCADDYALTAGVSHGIEELAARGRLSGTSALVTTRHWREHGRRVPGIATHCAVGLHLNFTLGQPLGAMPVLAPSGTFPQLGPLIRRLLSAKMDTAEIAAETIRQIDRFRDVAGRDPDFIDGHQHAHALPVIRTGVLTGLRAAFPEGGILVRDPADEPRRIVARRAAVPKSLVLASLARGFGSRLRAAGFRTNEGFAGVSAFDRATPFVQELARFFAYPGPRHLVMCHPGYPDAELAALDPVVERRRDEFDALCSFEPARGVLWLREMAKGGAPCSAAGVGAT